MYSFSQLSSYYQDRSAHGAAINKSTGYQTVTQITYVNYPYVRDRIATFLEDKAKYVPISDDKVVDKGDYELITRRYKSKYNDDIVIERRFIDVQYKVFKIGSEQIIESFNISGLEDYIGVFYTEFWNPSLNLIEKNGLLYDMNFMQDNVKIKYKSNNKYYKRDVWMEVTNKEIKTQKAFVAAYKAHFDKLLKLKKEFDDKRAKDVYSIEKVNSQDYASFVSDVNSVLNNNRKDFKDPVNNTFDINIVSDTLGNQTMTISNSSELPADVVNDLMKIKIRSYRELGHIMKSSDKYSFKISNDVKVMTVLEKDFKKVSVVNENQFTPELVQKGINTILNNNRGKGTTELQYVIQNINGKEYTDQEELSFKSKIGVKKVGSVVGGVALIGIGVAYYFINK